MSTEDHEDNTVYKTERWKGPEHPSKDGLKEASKITAINPLSEKERSEIKERVSTRTTTNFINLEDLDANAELKPGPIPFSEIPIGHVYVSTSSNLSICLKITKQQAILLRNDAGKQACKLIKKPTNATRIIGKLIGITTSE